MGTDGSPDSRAALGYAFDEANLRGAEVEVISALGLPQGWPRHALCPLPEDDEETEARRTDVEKQLQPLRDACPDVPVLLDVHRLDPLRTLARASQRVDLLVLGSRGRGGFHGLSVGSTTHKLLHLADCPLAVVRGSTRQRWCASSTATTSPAGDDAPRSPSRNRRRA